MSGDLIRFEAVWKAYPRFEAHERTLRAALSRRLPALVRAREDRWVLRDVSLAVPAGDMWGVIGQNGAGKSTLLRLGSGIGRPNRGAVLTAPRTASVLSLGDSFDFELSGRENALTLAMAMGLRRRAAAESLDAIIDFAELGDFADAPVRTYSDGMRLRLAFGVVAQLEPDVLLLDEVMAVGDVAFQAKCMDHVARLRERGSSIVLASHSLEEVAAECDGAIWLQAGAVRAHGPAAEVVDAYREAMRSATFERTPHGEADESGLELRRNRLGSQEAVIEDVRLIGAAGGETASIRVGDPLTVAFTVRSADAAVDAPIVGATITRGDNVVCYDTNTEGDGLAIERLERPRQVTLEFERLELVPGTYFVDVGIYERSWEYAYDYHWHVYPLEVTGRGGDAGVFRPPHRWRVD